MLPTSNHMKAPLNSMYFDCYWWTAVELKHVRWSKTKKTHLKIGIAVQRTTQFITSHPVEAFGLKGVTAGIVKLSPASSSTAIYRLCGGRGEKKASSFTRVIGRKCKLSKFTTIFETPPSQHFLQRFVDFLCNLVCWKVLKLFELKFINVVRYSLFDF